jgi:hypothetical protein
MEDLVSTSASSEAKVAAEKFVNQIDMPVAEDLGLSEDDDELFVVHRSRKRKRVVSDDEGEARVEVCHCYSSTRMLQHVDGHGRGPINIEAPPFSGGVLPGCHSNRGGMRHRAINGNNKALRMEDVSSGKLWRRSINARKDEKTTRDWTQELITLVGNSMKADIHAQDCRQWIQSFKAITLGRAPEQDMFRTNGLRHLTQRCLAARDSGLAMTFLEIVYLLQVASKVNR